MAIAIRGTNPASAGVDSPATVSVTLTGSTQPQAGDLLVIFHCNDFYALSNMPTPTVGGSTSGVTNILDCDSGTNGAHCRVWWYAVSATGDLTVSVTETGTADEDKALVVYVLSGADTTTPVDASGSAIDTGGTTHICPSISPTTTDAYLICHTNTGGGASGGGDGSYTHPGGMTETVDNRFTAGMHVGGAVLQLSASGATGTKTFTPSSAVTDQANVSVAIETGGAAAAADSSSYSIARLPGRIGPDGKVFTPGHRFDNNGSAVVATQAPAGDAEGTASAFPATAALGITPGTATASGSGLTARTALGVNPATATATSSGLTATLALGANSGTATAAGSALQPTVTTSGGTNAPAGLTSATGTAFAPTIAIGVLPGVPTATGAAQQPAAAERVNAGTATAAGSALQPTVRVGPSAGTASGSGAALTASTAIRINAGTATAAGVANQPTVSISGSVNAPAGVASATGAALSPQVAVAPVAATTTATGTALAGRITLRALPATATADGLAFGVAGPIQPVTPQARTYEIPADLREFDVLANNRTLTIPADPREFEVPAENRTYPVPADARTLVVPGDEET